jgi:hypothetical protein
MPRKSKVNQLPAEIKEWLDNALVENNFGEYRALADELKKRGFDLSKTALHRYGQDFEGRLKALKLVTEQARAVVKAAPDEDGAVNDALVRLTQEKMFGLLMELEIDAENVDLAKLARAVAELGKASVAQKRWQAEARKKALEEAAKEAGDAAKQVGITDDVVEQIKTRILGIDK